MRLLLCFLLGFSACGDDLPDGPPRDGGRRDLSGVDLGDGGEVGPRVEIGTGVTRFVEVENGDDVELVNGPQGGWHVDVALRLYGLDPQELMMRIEGHDPVTGDAVGIPIERVLTERRVLDEGDHYLRVGDQLIFAVTSPDEVVGADVRIDVRVSTPEGLSATAEMVVHVVDDEP